MIAGSLNRNHVRQRRDDERRALRRSRPPSPAARRQRLAQVPEVPALEPAAHESRPPRSKLSIARRAASMLVAFESLTNRTPSISRDGLQRVLETGEPLDRCRHRRRHHAGKRRDRGRREHIAEQVAARADGPTRAARAASPSGRAATIDAAVHDTPRSRRVGHREQQRRACRAPRAMRQRGRIVGIEDRPVVGRLVGEDPRLRRRVLVDDACRSRWSGEKFRSTAIHG